MTANALMQRVLHDGYSAGSGKPDRVKRNQFLIAFFKTCSYLAQTMDFGTMDPCIAPACLNIAALFLFCKILEFSVREYLELEIGTCVAAARV